VSAKSAMLYDMLDITDASLKTFLAYSYLSNCKVTNVLI
jgi:hypothetical protein